MCCACAIVNFAAVAMIGLKFRADDLSVQIAPAVRLPGFDQRHVAGERLLDRVLAAGKLPHLLAFTSRVPTKVPRV